METESTTRASGRRPREAACEPSPLRVQRHAADVHADRAEALRYLGYSSQAVSDELDRRIDSMIARCEAVSQPSFAYRVFPSRAGNGAIELAGSTLALPGRDIRAHLGRARAVAVLVCTLGVANERELARLSRTSELDALVFDAASSSLVESTANACEAAVAAWAHERGLVTNDRFSPGYGDLPLALQPDILRVLDAQRKLGVTVSESNLLIPQKSTTALIGLFDSADDAENVKRSCARCICAPQCALRKAGTPCFR